MSADINNTQMVCFHESVYRNMLNDIDTWKSHIEEDILATSDGAIRAFHIFFSSPEECFSGRLELKALSKSDIINKYPHLYDKAIQVPDDSYLYVFYCKDGIDKDKDLMVDYIIK